MVGIMKNISDHITYKEAVRSNTAIRKGISNEPNYRQLQNMKLVAEMIFEPLREYFGVPIFVSSFYRSWRLNREVGGSETSDHTKGCAIDLDDILGGVTNKQMFEFIRDNLDFDQLIWEYGDDDNPSWVHVSYRKEGNRKQVFRTHA